MKTELLLIALIFTHWMCDFTNLSTNWMLSAKRFGKPLFPIFFHALVHSFFLAWIIGGFMILQKDGLDLPLVGYAFTFELVTHFTIDVLKGRLNGWFPSLANPTNKFHWYVFGFDQFLHFFVLIIITFNILT